MSEVQVVESWLKHHERLLIVAMVLLAGSWGINHYLNNAAAKAETRAQIAEQALVVANQSYAEAKAQSARNDAAEAQVAQQYQAMISALTAQNASLAAAAAARGTALAQEQNKNKTLPLPELAKKWQTLENLQDSDLTASAAGITVSPTGAVTTVNALESVPVLTADLKDETQVAQNLQTELDKAVQLAAAQSAQVSSLISQGVAADKLLAATKDADTKELASVKASARKSKIRWFKIGFITGLVSGIYLGHAL